MFDADEVDAALPGIAPDAAVVRAAFEERLDDVLRTAGLARPDSDFAHRGGRSGTRHSEQLGHLLATMQWLPRAYPDATW